MEELEGFVEEEWEKTVEVPLNTPFCKLQFLNFLIFLNLNFKNIKNIKFKI
jgi:hypothetical protein